MIANSTDVNGTTAALTTQVLIVGAGPVGLTLAIDLGKRGIRCTLIEQKEAPQFLPKMERCNARSMEMFRRLGLADKIRAAGLPSPSVRRFGSSTLLTTAWLLIAVPAGVPALTRRSN